MNTKKYLLFGAVLAFGAVVASQLSPTLVGAKDCGGVEVAILECTTSNSGDAVQDSPLWAILSIVINILVAGVSIAAIGGIVYGAIQYSSAQDNPSQVQEAIGIIRNTVIGLVLFLMMWAGLEYLIPGGIF